MKLIAFDFDGVIIDSKIAMELAWNQIEKDFMLNDEYPFSLYLSHVGKPFPVIMQLMNLEDYMPDIQVQYFRYTSLYKNEIRIFDGLPEIVRHCFENRQMNTALITSKTESRTKELVKYLNLKFDYIVCPENTFRGKPHPDPLLLVNKLSEISPTSSIYIGDMEADYQAAYRAGWNYAHVNWGYGPPIRDLSKVCQSFDCPSDLLSYIIKFSTK